MAWLAVVATFAFSSSSLQDAGTVWPHPALSLPSPRTFASLNRSPFAASVHEPLLATCMFAQACTVCACVYVRISLLDARGIGGRGIVLECVKPSCNCKRRMISSRFSRRRTRGRRRRT